MSDGLKAGFAYTEIALAASAPLGSGIAERCGEKSLVFETIKRCVESSRGRLAASARPDLSCNCHAVCILAETQDGKEDDLLEFAEDRWCSHFIYIVVEKIGNATSF